MKQSFSQKETIEILKRALTSKDREEEEKTGELTLSDLEKMAGEFGISKQELLRAAEEITQTEEKKSSDLFPEVVTSKWISGRLSEEQVETFFAALKLEFGGTYAWSGKPSDIHRMGNTMEYQLKDAVVTLSEKDNGYQLRVIKQQFFHGNTLEAAIVSVPLAFLVGLLPVAAAAEFLGITMAVFTGALSYAATFFFVKRFTRRKRAETVTRLLHIADFAENRLRELPGSTKSDTITVGGDERNVIEADQTERTRLRS
jgi:hypothetical protein